MVRRIFRTIGKRFGRALFDIRTAQAAQGTLFNLGELIRHPRDQNEAVIRSLCQYAYLGGDTALCRILGRYKLLVDTGDFGVGVHLLADGYWEMWHTETMFRLLKPGMKAVDIGANLGYFSILMSDLVGAAGSVHCFEPNPDLARLLRRSLTINGFEHRATVHELALGDSSGTALLAFAEHEPGGGHIFDEKSGRPGIAVRTERFDAFAELADADYVKIDVEGAEESVWRGMRQLLESGRPLTIVLEFIADRYADAGAFIDEIAPYGFSLSAIDPDKGVIPATRAELLAKPATQDQLILLRR